MELILPDLKLPDIKEFPEPVIDYLAPLPPNYPRVLVPYTGPGKSSSSFPKLTPKGPIPEPVPEKSVAEKIVEDVVDAVQPALDSHTDAISDLKKKKSRRLRSLTVSRFLAVSRYRYPSLRFLLQLARQPRFPWAQRF